MPTVLVKIPQGAFPGDSRHALVKNINQAAAAAEQIPDDPRMRAMCWVLVNEVDPGAWTCGADDLTAQMLPCIAMVYLPAGVLDEAARHRYVQLMHDAFARAMPAGEGRRLVTSVTLFDVADATWGVNGQLWALADFARAAGFGHLQHLLEPAGASA